MIVKLCLQFIRLWFSYDDTMDRIWIWKRKFLKKYKKILNKKIVFIHFHICYWNKTFRYIDITFERILYFIVENHFLSRSRSIKLIQNIENVWINIRMSLRRYWWRIRIFRGKGRINTYWVDLSGLNEHWWVDWLIWMSIRRHWWRLKIGKR